MGNVSLVLKDQPGVVIEMNKTLYLIHNVTGVATKVTVDACGFDVSYAHADRLELSKSKSSLTLVVLTFGMLMQTAWNFLSQFGHASDHPSKKARQKKNKYRKRPGGFKRGGNAISTV